MERRAPRPGDGDDAETVKEDAPSGAAATCEQLAVGPAQVAAVVDRLERTVVCRWLQPARPSTREPDGGARIAYVSRNVARILGPEPEELVRDAGRLYRLIEPNVLPDVLAEQYRAFADGDRLELDVPFLVHDGDIAGRRVFRINATPEPLEGGGVAWNGTLTDITQSAEKARLMEVVEVSPDLIGTVDAAGRVVYLNPAGHALLGLKWSSNPDQRIAEVGVETLHPPDMQELYWNEIVPTVKREGVWTGETQIVDREGRRIPVSQVVVAHRGPSDRPGRPGPITHLSTIVRDMSARVEMEERLRAARRASETARDAAESARAHAENMTHEVNHRVKNLFALVPAIVQLTARSTPDLRSLVDKVRERMSALARSHDLTLNENGELAGIGLEDLLRTVLGPYRETFGDTVRLEGPALAMNAADGNALSLVLHELATNAAKHGALASAEGRLDVTWDVEARAPDALGDEDSRWRALALTWRERLAEPRPDAAAPDHQGSGTALLDRLVRAQHGTITREWLPEGLTLRIDLPIHGARRPRRETEGAGARLVRKGTGDANDGRQDTR